MPFVPLPSVQPMRTARLAIPSRTLLQFPLPLCGNDAAGWSWGYCSAVTPDGWRWIVDAHRDGRRYIVQSDELLSAFLELEQTLL